MHSSSFRAYQFPEKEKRGINGRILADFFEFKRTTWSSGTLLLKATRTPSRYQLPLTQTEGLYITHLAPNPWLMTNFWSPSIRQKTGLISTVSCLRVSVKSHRNDWVAVYYDQNNGADTKFARELHERVRREFPEVSVMSNISGSSLMYGACIATYL